MYYWPRFEELRMGRSRPEGKLSWTAFDMQLYSVSRDTIAKTAV